MPKFIKNIEDFTCEHCGATVQGTGYTNHCPKCLWSKHEDVDPGDRASECHGLMKPIDIYYGKQEWIVVHQCQICGYTHRNKITDEDDFSEVIRLEKEINDKKMKSAGQIPS